MGSVRAERESDVVPAETERIRYGPAVIAVARLAGHDIQIDLGVEVFEAKGGRHDAVPQRLNGKYGLYRSSGDTARMPRARQSS